MWLGKVRFLDGRARDDQRRGIVDSISFWKTVTKAVMQGRGTPVSHICEEKYHPCQQRFWDPGISAQTWQRRISLGQQRRGGVDTLMDVTR